MTNAAFLGGTNAAEKTRRMSPATNLALMVLNGSMEKPLRLGIVDNDELTLNALQTYFRNRPDEFTVMWGATSGAAAVRLCASPESRPEILLIDMSLSDMNGTTVARKIHATAPSVRIPMLALTSFPLKIYAQDAADAGMQGIIAKRSLANIATALRAIADGDTWNTDKSSANFPSLRDLNGRSNARQLNTTRVSEASREAFAPPSISHNDHEVSQPWAHFTPREAQLLNLYAHGHTSSFAADQLGISINTVKKTTARLFQKLGVSTRGEAIAVWLGMPRNHENCQEYSNRVDAKSAPDTIDHPQ